ncbi:hypothetical protein YC2023_094938 [Brassica napus]
MVLYSNKLSYVWNDEDVFGYLLQVNHEKCRSVLHVEFNKTVQEEDDEADVYVGLSDREATDGEATDTWATDREACEADGVLTLYDDIEIHGNVTERDAIVIEDTEARPSVEVTPAVKERDDGMDLAVGQEFRTKEEAQVHIQTASHLKCFEYDVIKSDTKRYVIKCRAAKEGCKWYVRVAKLMNSDSWTVRSYIKQHRCSVVTTRTLPNRRGGTPGIVAAVLAQDYPGSLDTPAPNALIQLVHHRVAVKVSYTTSWRGKRLAANKVRGSPEESYTLLNSYMHMLKQSNPGTVARVVVDEAQKFKYLFFAFGASIKGFTAMRKVLIVDATHLKNVYGGVLFVATAQDPDHHHYPIAFGIADGEKEHSWVWFMEQLKSVISDVPGLVFLSDRNKSLIKAVSLVFSQAAHGYCIWIWLRMLKYMSVTTEKLARLSLWAAHTLIQRLSS